MKKIEDYTNEEWENICTNCGKCCLIKLQDETLCNDKAFYDWNNGSGARYYNPKKNQSNLICSLIMCGYAFPYVGDLSFGSIYGLTSHGEEVLVDVGFFRGGVRRTIRFHQ